MGRRSQKGLQTENKSCVGKTGFPNIHPHDRHVYGFVQLHNIRLLFVEMETTQNKRITSFLPNMFRSVQVCSVVSSAPYTRAREPIVKHR